MKRPELRADVAAPPYELYRAVVWALLVSSLLQLQSGTIPSSLSTGSPEWYDWAYMLLQAFASIVILISFYMPHVRPGLNLEGVGCLAGATVTLSYWVAVWFQNEGPPLSSGVWIAAAFGYFCIRRLSQIGKIFRNAEG